MGKSGPPDHASGKISQGFPETLPKDVLYALDSSQGAGPMSATQLQLPFRCRDRRCGRMERGVGMASLLGRGWDTTNCQSINRPVDLTLLRCFLWHPMWSSEMVDFHRTELAIYVKRAPPSRHASSLARKVGNSLRGESRDRTATILHKPNNSGRHNQQQPTNNGDTSIINVIICVGLLH